MFFIGSEDGIAVILYRQTKSGEGISISPVRGTKWNIHIVYTLLHDC